MLIVRILIFVLLASILVSLFSALRFMLRNTNKERQTQMARALTIRVTLSLALFFLLMIAFYFGLIPGHGHP